MIKTLKIKIQLFQKKKLVMDEREAENTSVLASMTEDSQYFLADKRDDKAYCVAKLKDGNIWMTQNLDHEIDKTYNYTSENTNIGWNSSTNSYDNETWVPVASTHTSNDTEWYEYNEINNPEGGDDLHAESYDAGELYWNGVVTVDADSEDNCITAGGIWDKNNRHCNLASPTGNSHYHLGNYYNWAATIATNDISIYGYGDATDEYIVDSGKSIDRSICPSGWTLPKDRSDYSGTDSYINLLEQYGIDYVTADSYAWNSPLLFTLSGTYTGYYSSSGEAGRYWVPTISDWDES